MQSTSPLMLRGGVDGFGDDTPAPRRAFSPLSSIWRYRYVILATALAFAGVAALRGWLAAPAYKSDALIFVRHGALAAVGDQGNSHASNLQTQTKVIQSSRIISAAVGKVREKTPRTMVHPTAAVNIYQGLGVTTGTGADLIALSFRGPDAVEAQIILDAVIDAYLEFHAERKVALRADYERESAELTKELDAKMQSLAQLRQRLGVLGEASEAARSLRLEISGAREQLASAREEADQLSGAYNSAGNELASPEATARFIEMLRVSGAMAPDPVVSSLREQLLGARQARGELAGQLMAQHPRLKAASEHVAALEAALILAERRCVEAYALAFKQRADAANLRSRSLEEKMLGLIKDGAARHKDLASLDRVEADVQRIERQMETLAQRRQPNDTRPDSAAAAVQVVEPPSVNLMPLNANRTKPVAFAGLVGLIAACLFAVIAGRLDTRVRSASELNLATQLPVLASMPRVRDRREQQELGRMVDLEPLSEFSEACRAVRTALFFSGAKFDPRTILITSSTPGEGKSTLAANLAIAIARSGRRVLLIDADLRKPVQHDIFQTIGRADLPRLLSGDQTLESAIQASGVENLSLMISSKPPENPSELLNSHGFIALLEELTLKYTHIVIDSPPVSVATDARILSALASVSLLVVRAGKSTRAVVTRSHEALSHVGGNVLGLVLNHAVDPRDRFGNYGYYAGDAKRDAAAPDRITAALPEGSAAMNKTAAVEPAGA